MRRPHPSIHTAHTACATVVLAAHLTAHLLWCVAAAARCEWRLRDRPITLGRLARMCRYYLLDTLNPREHLPLDGAEQPPAPLAPSPRAHLNRAARRSLRELRRGQIAALLRALGDDAQTVEATLDRVWERDRGIDAGWVLEDYLRSRAAWREAIPPLRVEPYPWAVNAGGVWTPTPAPVRAYLRHRAADHRARLTGITELT